jgi:CHASE3 domain sensor protein
MVNSMNRLLAGLVDAETGQLGFVLTGEPHFLEPYNRAIQSVPTELANLNRLSDPSPERPDPAQLNNLVNQKLMELRQTVDLRLGKRTMDQIREIGAAIQERGDSGRLEASRGGRMWAAANEGGGLTVQFALPAGAEDGIHG